MKDDNAGQRPAEPVLSDYDQNPGLVRLARSVLHRHAVAGDVHELVARHFVEEDFARAPPGGVLGEATALASPDESFDGVAILYVLYHLPDPRLALAEANRVMRQGGLIAVAAPSRHDSPELAHALPKGPLTFDAELAPGLLRELFEEPEVMRRDAPLIELPTARVVRDYLIGKQAAPDRAQAVAAATEPPLSVTKRGPCCSPVRAGDRPRPANVFWSEGAATIWQPSRARGRGAKHRCPGTRISTPPIYLLADPSPPASSVQMCKRGPKDFAMEQRGGSKVYGAMSLEVLEQRRKEMLREAELNRLKKVLQPNRKRPATSRWASAVAWELARALGLLRKFFRTPKNPD